MKASNSSSSDSDDCSRTRGPKRRRKTRNDDEKARDLDRISGLLNPLLLHILSFLPTKHAATTSVLSKKWKHLWTFIPILDFHDGRDIRSYEGSDQNLSNFVTLVNRSLLLNQAPMIEKFRVCMYYKKAFASEVDVWLRLLKRKNVKELDLNFSPSEVHSNYDSSSVDDDDDDDDENDNDNDNDDDDDDDDDNDDYSRRYHLPMNMFSKISSLTTLKLKNCDIDHGKLINWKFLKVLSLSRIFLNDGFIAEILSGCPSLELLELLNCWNCYVVDIKSERLRKLVISECEIPPEDDGFAMKISAPYLQSLDISGFLYKYSVINSSSLVDAKLNFDQSSYVDQNHDKYTKILVQLLENLRHVKDLTLGSWCLQVLSMLEAKALHCPRLSLVCLRVETSFHETQIPGITTLLRHTPSIETLIIKSTFVSLYRAHLETMFLQSHDLGGENYWSSPKRSFASALLNLKTVRIIDFGATEIEVELLFFLLKNASMIEKMIIHARNTIGVSLKRSVEVAQRLLRFPRCSQDTVVFS